MRIGKLIRKIIGLALLISILVVFSILRNNQNIAEWWSRNIARGYVNFVGGLVKNVPFSLSEVIFIILLILIIITIIFVIKDFIRLRIVKALIKIVSLTSTIMGIVLMVFISSGFNYNRKPVDLPYYPSQVDNSEFVNIYNFYVDDLNDCISQLEFKANGDVDPNKSLAETSKIVENAYTSLLTTNYYSSFNGHAKAMIFSFLFSELQLLGITIPPLGEPNVNNMVPNAEKPFTIAHEIAHTKGVMREDDANQVAFYICLNSDDPYLRYSAYTEYFYQLNRLKKDDLMTPENQALLHAYDQKFVGNNTYIIKFWNSHKFLKDIGDKINDWYIKGNGINEGTNSYIGGTESSVEPGTGKLNASKYHKLFFERYYRLSS